jgi:hypothetical protein
MKSRLDLRKLRLYIGLGGGLCLGRRPWRPADGLDIRCLALIYAIVMQFCEENKVRPPEWAKLSLEL